MKRFILSTLVVLLGSTAIASAVSAQERQLSTPDQLSEGATITDLVQHNRDARSKK
ncbi:hypothetical protein BH23CYA1_BH23CYA1_21030 [soil metagenome]